MPHDIKLGLNFLISDEKVAYIFVKKPPPYHVLAICGGGAKGVVYPGALTALENKNILANLQAVGGSSVGALIATLVALGLTAIEIQTKINAINFFDLIKDRGVSNLETMLARIVHDGIQSQLKKYLKIKNTDAILKNINPEKKSAIIKILNKNGHISFNDLEYLRKHFYQNQKQLLITGTNLTDKKLELFSHKTTPDMDIIKANRISASLPIFFKQVKFNNKNYMDGGLLNNLPIEPLQLLAEIRDTHLFPERKISSLALKLDSNRTPDKNFAVTGMEKSPEIDTLYGTNINSFALKSTLSKKLFANIDGTYADFKMRQALRNDFSQRVINLNAPGLSVISFYKANKNKTQLQINAQKEVDHYLNIHSEELMYFKTNDIFELVIKADVNDLKNLKEQLTSFLNNFPLGEQMKVQQAIAIIDTRIKYKTIDKDINDTIEDLVILLDIHTMLKRSLTHSFILNLLTRLETLWENYKKSILHNLTTYMPSYEEMIFDGILLDAHPALNVLLKKIKDLNVETQYIKTIAIINNFNFNQDAADLKEKIQNNIYDKYQLTFDKKKRKEYKNIIHQLASARTKNEILEIISQSIKVLNNAPQLIGKITQFIANHSTKTIENKPACTSNYLK